MKLKKNQIEMKLKTLNCDKIQKLKLWQNNKTQIVTKLKTQIGTKKIHQKTQTLVVIKLKNSNRD